jgi:hypothetical protein
LLHGSYGGQSLVHQGNPRFAMALRGQPLAPVESREPHLVPKALLGYDGQGCLGPPLGSRSLSPKPMERRSLV